MKNQSNAWQNLSRAARPRWLTGGAPVEPPWGFHARVLARVRQERGVPMELWLRMAVRALPVAAGVLLVCWLAFPAMEAEPDLVELVLQEALPW